MVYSYSYSVLKVSVLLRSFLMFNLFVGFCRVTCVGNMSDKIATVGGKCVFCHQRGRNADPLIPLPPHFSKAPGWGWAGQSKHPSISGFHGTIPPAAAAAKKRESNRHQTEIVGTGISLMPITAAATGVSRPCANFVLLAPSKDSPGCTSAAYLAMLSHMAFLFPIIHLSLL